MTATGKMSESDLLAVHVLIEQASYDLRQRKPKVRTSKFQGSPNIPPNGSPSERPFSDIIKWEECHSGCFSIPSVNLFSMMIFLKSDFSLYFQSALHYVKKAIAKDPSCIDVLELKAKCFIRMNMYT